MDGHFQGPKIFLLGRFVFVVILRAFLFIFTPQAQKVGGFDLKRSLYSLLLHGTGKTYRGIVAGVEI